MVVGGPIKWHGGKAYLAKRIVALMQPCTHYVEPYAGGLAVLLARDPEGVSEVANDLYGALSNFWKALASPTFKKFIRMVEAVPFCEASYNRSLAIVKRTPENMYSERVKLRQAVHFFIVCRQSLAGRMKDFATLSRRRTRRGMNEQASAWLTAIEGLPELHERLKRVVILNRPALDVIRQQDGPKTCFYLDPPYLSETRTSPNTYELEMTTDDHEQLLAVVSKCDGQVLISGYDNPMYNSLLRSWTRHEFDLPNNAAGGTGKRRMTEVVWSNRP